MAYTTIDDPTIYFNTVLWTGDGASSKSITGVGFQPDWVWIKRRDSAGNQNVFDVIRGANNYLLTDVTNAEATISDRLTSFDSDGFTVGDSGNTNASSGTYVAWNWLADNTTGSSNTDGSITSTVSANTTAGFSFGTYTGNATNSTIGHGLGKKPEFIITKRRNSTSSWRTQHGSRGATETASLDASSAFTASSAVYNDTEPTSSVFTIGTASSINASGGTFVFYAFTSIKGYSKMGSYIGNGNADGTFVHTGFKPAMIIWKQTNTTRSWYMMDNKRNTFNVTNNFLRPDTSAAESTAANSIADFLSNGFKLRGTGADINQSGGSYIYMAFAESPFVTAGTKAAGTAR